MAVKGGPRPSYTHRRRQIRSYRYWLYGFNIVLIVVLIAFVSITCKILHKDRMYLFPLDHSEPLVVYLFCGPFLQVLDILAGLLGVWRQKTILLTCYWWFLLGILLCDLVIGILWIFRWRWLHSTSGKHFLHSISTQYDSPAFCRRWNSVQDELSCCGVYSISDWTGIEYFCDEDLVNGTRLPQSCCGNAMSEKMVALCLNGSDSEVVPTTSSPEGLVTVSPSTPPGCRDAMIKWLYKQSNIVFLVGVCVVLFLKVVGLVIMRTEIRKLGDEIYARENRDTLLAQPKFSLDLSPCHNGDTIRDTEMDLSNYTIANWNLAQGSGKSKAHTAIDAASTGTEVS